MEPPPEAANEEERKKKKHGRTTKSSLRDIKAGKGESFAIEESENGERVSTRGLVSNESERSREREREIDIA